MYQKLGALAITVWFSFSIYNIYTLTSPPVCLATDSDCVHPENASEDYALHVYLSNEHPKGFAIRPTSPVLDHGPIPIPRARDATYLGTFYAKRGAENTCDDLTVRSNIIETEVEPLIQPVQQGLVRRTLMPATNQCVASFQYTIPRDWRSNNTHVFLTALATRPDNYTQTLFYPALQELSLSYIPEKKHVTPKRYLLAQKADDPQVLEEHAKMRIKSYASMSLPKVARVGPVAAYGKMSKSRLQQNGLSHWVHGESYLGQLYPNTLVSPRDEYQSLINTPNDLDITIKIELEATSYRQWAIHQRFLGAIESMEKTFGTSQYDSDSFKLLLAGESPLILLVTFVVSAFHLLFEYLAMSSNFTHFRETTADAARSERVSRRSVGLDLIFEIFILAWLRDEGEATIVQIVILAKIMFNLWRYTKLSRMQSKSSKDEGLGALEILKLHAISVIEPFKPSHLRSRRSAVSSDQFEKECIISLAFIAVPAMIAFALYQLIFVPQKGWISWGIKTCAMSSYVGGFIAMTPQLYKNFYFKSVEHLPWTTLTYQFLNTIIDDLFSFLIRMPNAHRVSVFRDDIIFVIYWIQKRHYKGQMLLSDEPDQATVTKSRQAGTDMDVKREAIRPRRRKNREGKTSTLIM